MKQFPHSLPYSNVFSNHVNNNIYNQKSEVSRSVLINGNWVEFVLVSYRKWTKIEILETFLQNNNDWQQQNKKKIEHENISDNCLK